MRAHPGCYEPRSDSAQLKFSSGSQTDQVQTHLKSGSAQVQYQVLFRRNLARVQNQNSFRLEIAQVQLGPTSESAQNRFSSDQVHTQFSSVLGTPKSAQSDLDSVQLRFRRRSSLDSSHLRFRNSTKTESGLD